MENPVTNLAEAFYHSVNIAFTDIQQEKFNWELGFAEAKAAPKIMVPRRPHASEVEVVAMFGQMWNSTALGFGGIGGAAMTTAYTIILRCKNETAVYFGGRFAYLVTRCNDYFMDDLRNQNMGSIDGANKFYEHVK